MDTGTDERDAADLEALWQRALLDARAQALDDLARAGSAAVVFVRHERAAAGVAFLDALEARAWARGFATARVPVFEERAFDALDALVRAVGRALVAGPPRDEDSDAPRRGVVALLDAFAATHGDAALAAFDAAAARHGAAGDLAALARAYLDAAHHPPREATRLTAWLAGTDLARVDDAPVALAPLGPRTARRALGEITALARALGHAGTLIVFEGADLATRLPAARRERAYTVLRELVDNADGGRGLVATQVVVAGAPALFDGPRSLATLAPLWTRIQPPRDAPATDAPPPHRPLVDLAPPRGWTSGPRPAPRHGSTAPDALELRALIRAAQGLPAVDPVVSLSVAHERVDATITALLDHGAARGSVFVPLVGAYGAGKTHLLLHLAARALAAGRPVLRLSLETLDADLGNPQRHLRRLLEHGTLPLPHAPSPLDRLVAWTRAPRTTRRLLDALDAIAARDGDEAPPARRALRLARAKGARPAAALEAYLSGEDLAARAATPGYRHDAYARLLLWFALLEALEGCGGPVLLLDEAENLFRGGTTRAERRTALRSLAFYCGGTLPSACVVLAITPEALAALRAEAPALLTEVAAQRTALAWEDAEMLRRRLRAARALEAPALGRDGRTVLAFRLRAAHAAVRGGEVADPAWAGYVATLVKQDTGPREVVRRVVDRLERLWWAGRAPG